MSIVGPRPRLAHDEYYSALIPTYAARLGQAGLTGYAQVNGFRGEIRDTQGMSDRCDGRQRLYRSLVAGLDVAILARTVPDLQRPRAY